MKESFAHAGSTQLFKLLETAAAKTGKSRGQTFEDFLLLVTCALSGGRMEEQYLEIAGQHAEGKKGKRSIDVLTEMFARLVMIMEETRADILGDLFVGAISYGERGQFYTPECLTQLMAELAGSEGHTVSDPCCGSGRMLLAAADVNRHREFVGQDVDLRCVRMTAINLALRNLYGHVIWGDTLRNERLLIYRTGFDGQGFIALMDPPGVDASVPVSSSPHTTPSDSSKCADREENSHAPPIDTAEEQMRLF